MIFTTVEPAADLTIHELIGPVGAEEWRSYARGALKGSSTSLVLWDLSRGFLVDVGFQEASGLLRELRSALPGREGERMAILLASPPALQSGDPLPGHDRSDAGSINWFLDFGEAEAWLLGPNRGAALAPEASRAA